MLWDKNASALLGPTISFQLRLYETTNVVAFQYALSTGLVSGSAGASIGLAGVPGNNQGFLSVSNSLTGSSTAIAQKIKQ